ncbi:MAG: hypothetical protein HC882_02385 [Acidobacteria bacterium]|nr:hypothetical protein [Acidobacteriota bacterium]
MKVALAVDRIRCHRSTSEKSTDEIGYAVLAWPATRIADHIVRTDAAPIYVSTSYVQRKVSHVGNNVRQWEPNPAAHAFDIQSAAGFEIFLALFEVDNGEVFSTIVANKRFPDIPPFPWPLPSLTDAVTDIQVAALKYLALLVGAAFKHSAQDDALGVETIQDLVTNPDWQGPREYKFSGRKSDYRVSIRLVEHTGP